MLLLYSVVVLTETRHRELEAEVEALLLDLVRDGIPRVASERSQTQWICLHAEAVGVPRASAVT
jgi:hypothetical protein